MDSARILIIEDAGRDRELLHAVLAESGHAVLEAGLGVCGLQLAGAEKPNLILLDITLPDISGIEVARKLKREVRTRAIPIIAVMTEAMERDDRIVLNSGCDAFLAKPIDADELRRFVHALLSRPVSRSRPSRPAAGAGRTDPSVPIHLPPTDTKWTSRRKAALVLAVRAGVISLDEACDRYRLSPEEFSAWEAAFERSGLPGLRATRR